MRRLYANLGKNCDPDGGDQKNNSCAQTRNQRTGLLPESTLASSCLLASSPLLASPGLLAPSPLLPVLGTSAALRLVVITRHDEQAAFGAWVDIL
jgi:hypothetical protein